MITPSGYRGPLPRLIGLLLAWFLLVGMACGLILSHLDPATPTNQPRRTRAPLDTRP